MFALQLLVSCFLFSGSLGFSSYWFNMFDNCDPPQKVLGKFCAAVIDDDVDRDGDVDKKDIEYGLILYDYDGDPCNMQKWELVKRWTCRYGWSEEYARWLFRSFDIDSDGVLGAIDFAGPFMFTNQDFLMRQYLRFKNEYCSVPANRENKIDRALCAEVDALKQEDVKCDYI